MSAEKVIPLSAVPNELPRRRRGRKVHISTLHRWATVGCKGVVLETLSVGACRCTSKEALQRFFETISARQANPHGQPEPVPPRSATARRRASERAEVELKAMGA